MNVLYVVLMAIAAMALIVLSTVPFIFVFRGWDAWQAVPGEIYACIPQRIGPVRPTHIWAGVGIVSFIRDALRWAHQPFLVSASDAAGSVLMFMVLLWHVVWAAGIMRRRADLDARLVRFARYALWGASGMLALLIANNVARFFSNAAG